MLIQWLENWACIPQLLVLCSSLVLLPWQIDLRLEHLTNILFIGHPAKSHLANLFFIFSYISQSYLFKVTSSLSVNKNDFGSRTRATKWDSFAT